MMKHKVKVVIFWHTYLDNDFKLLVQEQMTKLFTSGLYERADVINTGISSPSEDNTKWFLELLSKYPKFHPLVHVDNDAEKATLRVMDLYCKANVGDDYYVMYFHTKAVTNTSYNNILWRWSMDYNIIHRWKDCLFALNGADAVGINLRYDTHLGYHPHFSGTYWWSKANYIRTLQEKYLYDKEYLLDLHPKANILLAEFYIGSNHQGKLKSMFECGDVAPYNTECLITEYIKPIV